MRTKIRIIAKNHPHFGEYGEFTSSDEGTIAAYMVLGEKKIKVDLINCPHGVKSCFVGYGETDPEF